MPTMERRISIIIHRSIQRKYKNHLQRLNASGDFEDEGWKWCRGILQETKVIKDTFRRHAPEAPPIGKCLIFWVFEGYLD